MNSVLVIDDDRGLRDLLAEYLTGRGLSVATAPDGEDGIRQIRAGGVDLVVLDIMMPGPDGLETTRRIRAFSTVPIIMPEPGVTQVVLAARYGT